MYHWIRFYWWAICGNCLLNAWDRILTPDKTKVNKKFDNRVAWPVTHTIYLILFMGTSIKCLSSLLITKLDHCFIILDRLYMKKYGVLLDLIYDSIFLSLRYCLYFGVLLILVPIIPTAEAKMKFMASQRFLTGH